jgi:hypothetical protein
MTLSAMRAAPREQNPPPQPSFSRAHALPHENQRPDGPPGDTDILSARTDAASVRAHAAFGRRGAASG